MCFLNILGDNRLSSFLELNPRGKVPVFRLNDLVLYESHAILMYLEDNTDLFGSDVRLLPCDRDGRGLCIQRMIETEYLSHCILAFKSFFSGKKLKEDSPCEYYTAYTMLMQELLRWNCVMEDRPYVMGDFFTMADVCLVSFLGFIERFGMDFDQGEGLENLSRYWNSMKKRESVVNSYPPHWRETPRKTVIVFEQEALNMVRNKLY